MLGLAKFKDSFVQHTGKEIIVFTEQIKTVLAAKKKKAEDDRVAEAVAKATAPAPRGGILGSFF